MKQGKKISMYIYIIETKYKKKKKGSGRKVKI